MALVGLSFLLGCDDFVSSHEPAPILHGSFDVLEAVQNGDSDLLGRGWQIGINFLQGLPDVFMVVQLAPDEEFSEAIVLTGGFRTEWERKITFYSESGIVLDRAEYFEEAGGVMRLELEGGLGFREMRTVPWSFPGYPYLSGIWEPEEFRLVDEEGVSVDLATVPEASVSMVVDAFWGQHRTRVRVPEGVLGESELDVTYVGRFNTVGTSVVLHDTFGCEVFAGEAVLAADVAFRGFACDIGGKPYLLKAHFRR